MARLPRLLAGYALLSYSRAFSDTSSDTSLAVTPTQLTVEQYCFPRSNGPFSDGSIWPSVTMIYSGTTLTTTPITLTMTQDMPTPGLDPAKSASGDIRGPVAPSSIADLPLISSQTMNDVTSGLTASPSEGPLYTQDGPVTGSSTKRTLSDASGADSSPTAASEFATRNSDGGTDHSKVPILAPNSPSGIGDARETDRSSMSAGPPMLSTSDTVAITAYSTSPYTTSRSRVPVSTGGYEWPTMSPGTGSVGNNKPSPTDTGPRLSASPGPLAPANGGSDQSAGGLNSTLELSPAATDALSLAQFLKNLGISAFETGIQTTEAKPKGDTTTIAFATLVANISLQEQAQQKTLRQLSLRAGIENIPSCEYILPSNVTETASIMSALKAVEGGVLMSLAESLTPEDKPAAVVLSSMSSVAARQNALLRPFVMSNASVASFDTPMSATWAYNLALAYVKPGSCVVEQPIPLLPTLSLDDRVAAVARSGSRVTLAWDAAGRAAASRSGRPLFVGWVNQIDAPTYTPLTSLGDGRGTTDVPAGISGTAFAVLTAQPGLMTIDELTDATLAGPVVVSLF